MDTLQTETARRRLTRKERQGLLTRFHQSRLTQREFAARPGIGLSTLGKWLKREEQAAVPPVEFQELKLPTSGSRWPVEVVSPRGWIVRWQHASELPQLSQLLRALPC